jgi:hypothetical protein
VVEDDALSPVSKPRPIHQTHPMALPPDDVDRIRRWCEAQVPEHARDRVRIESDVAQRHVTIVEMQPYVGGFDTAPRFPIARLRYVQYARMWTLYWRDRNLEFHEYDRLEPTEDVQVILDFLASHQDPIFWG